MTRWIFWIVILAVAVRTAVGMVHPFWFPDSVDYDTLARGILQGRYAAGGMVASRMPGYPIFLAGIYAQTNGAVCAVMIVQAVTGGLIVWLTYLIGRRAGETVGLIAAILVALDPLSVAFSAAVLSETPFTLALMAALWLCVCRLGCDEGEDHMRHRSEYRPVVPGAAWTRNKGWIALGIVWAAAVYFRAEALWGLVPLGMVASLGCKGPWARRAGHVILAVAFMFLLLAPWQVRNFREFGSGYFRMTTLEGISLYEAVYPEADGGPRQDFVALPAQMRAMGEAKRNDEWARRGWGFVKSDPKRIAQLAIKKIGRMWSPALNAEGYRNRWVQVGMIAWHVPLFVLAIVGLLAGVLRRREKWLLLAPVLYFTAVHALFLGSVRYRVPLDPIVCIFAAAGLMHLVCKMGKDKPAHHPVV